MEFIHDLFMLLGRVCLSLVFLISAYEKIKNWDKTQMKLQAKGVPYVNYVMPVGVGLKIVGGLMVLFGFHAHIGALLLLIVAIPSLYWIHRFWQANEPEKMVEKILFLKTVGIIGGLFYILVLGSGSFGVN